MADVVLQETASGKDEPSKPQPQWGSVLIEKWGFNALLNTFKPKQFSDSVLTGPEENNCFLISSFKKRIQVWFYFVIVRKEGSKSGCFSPWKFQFCENCLFTGQPSQRESPASPSANISARSLELIQRSFSPLDIFIMDLNKLWTSLFWQEHTESGNLKINPDLELCTAFQQPWWYIGMSLSERRWCGDLAISVARLSLAVCWDKHRGR